MATSCRTVFPLADCHPSILQRVIGLCDKEDLFLLRLVSRSFRAAVGLRVKQLRPSELPADLAAKFPKLVSLDLSNLTRHEEDAPTDLSAKLTPLLPRLLQLRELRGLSLDRIAHADQLLPTLQALTWLQVKSIALPDVVLAVVARCTSLQHLDVRKIYHTSQLEAIQQAVARLESLVRLELQFELFPYEEEAQLQTLLPFNTGKLEVLHVHCKIYNAGAAICAQLRAFSSLTAVEVACRGLSDDGIAQLCALTRLTSLRLEEQRGSFTCAGVAQLTKLLQLADLRLTRIRSGGEHLQAASDVLSLGEALSGLPSLRQLELDSCGGVELGNIGGAHSRLTQLVLYHVGLRDQPRCLQPLTGLRRLRLRLSQPEESQLRYLSGMVELTHLDIGSGELEFTAAGASWLAQLTALQRLSLDGNHSISAAALEQLARLPALSALDLSLMGQLATLAPLERLPLNWLRLPANYRSADELPERLRVPFLRGCRHSFYELS